MLGSAYVLLPNPTCSTCSIQTSLSAASETVGADRGNGAVAYHRMPVAIDMNPQATSCIKSPITSPITAGMSLP